MTMFVHESDARAACPSTLMQAVSHMPEAARAINPDGSFDGRLLRHIDVATEELIRRRTCESVWRRFALTIGRP